MHPMLLWILALAAASVFAGFSAAVVDRVATTEAR